MKISTQSMIELLHNINKTISPCQVRHVQRTTIIAAHLAKYFDFDEKTCRGLFLAGMIDYIDTLKNAPAHCELRNDMPPIHSAVSGIRFLSPVSELLNVPLTRRLLQMASAFERFLTRTGNHHITLFLAQSGTWPGPLVDALKKSGDEEGFWFCLSSPSPDKVLNTLSPLHDEMLDHNDLIEVCRLIGHIIDQHSGFTASHSAGVARVAEKLAALYGFEQEMQIKIGIAGYLHDIGKLHIPRDILEKQGQLEPSEYTLMKQHSYKTLELLTSVDALGEIAHWAANHHERLDGSGYPFRLCAASLDIPSRIVAVADVFTALTENRPYRHRMSGAEALTIMECDAVNNRLDKEIVAVLAKNRDNIIA